MSNSGGSWPQDRLRRKVLWVEGGDRRERCVTWYAYQNFPVSFVCVAEVCPRIHYGRSIAFLEVTWESPVGCGSHIERAEPLWAWEHLPGLPRP